MLVSLIDGRSASEGAATNGFGTTPGTTPNIEDSVLLKLVDRQARNRIHSIKKQSSRIGSEYGVATRAGQREFPKSKNKHAIRASRHTVK